MMNLFRLYFSKLPAETKGLLKTLNQQILLGSLASGQGKLHIAVEYWQQAWDSIKNLAAPEIHSLELFSAAYPGLVSDFPEFFFDFLHELQNVGLHDPAYYEACSQFVHEFLGIFPLENEHAGVVVNFRRAEAESLWNLGRIAESEAVYVALVEQYPDEGWAYIGWADQYWFWRDTPGEYARGEAILLRALKRPNLTEKEHALERLMNLYAEWGKDAKADAIEKQLDAFLAAKK